jgi:hypothetical protein
MNVDLDPTDRKDLEELARAEGKEVGALLRELVHEAISERKRNGDVPRDDANAVHEQQEALEELHQTLDALPPEGPQDGFTGRDHDKVLYGGPAPGQKGGFPERRS